MSFLQYVESAPFCAYFRSLLQRAYSRATSRPVSPAPMSNSTTSLLSTTGSGDKHTPSVPKKALADFQVALASMGRGHKEAHGG
jgi:hypothetical protein